MRMPSLIKYFTVVGSLLLGLLLLVNQFAAPEAGEAKTHAAKRAPEVTAQNDPRASAVERWRNQIAALREAEHERTAYDTSITAKPGAVGQVQPAAEVLQPVAQPAPVETPRRISEAANPAQPLIEKPAQLQDQAAEAKVAAEKTRATKAKAAKAKLTRERAAAAKLAPGEGGLPVTGHYSATRERSASNLQDQYYYGQRSASAQPVPSQGYAYAPQRSYGPFGGFGRVW